MLQLHRTLAHKRRMGKRVWKRRICKRFQNRFGMLDCFLNSPSDGAVLFVDFLRAEPNEIARDEELRLFQLLDQVAHRRQVFGQDGFFFHRHFGSRARRDFIMIFRTLQLFCNTLHDQIGVSLQILNHLRRRLQIGRLCGRPNTCSDTLGSNSDCQANGRWVTCEWSTRSAFRELVVGRIRIRFGTVRIRHRGAAAGSGSGSVDGDAAATRGAGRGTSGRARHT